MSTSLFSRLGGRASQKPSASYPNNVAEEYDRGKKGLAEIEKGDQSFQPTQFPDNFPYNIWYSRSAQIFADYSVPGGVVHLEPGESLQAIPQPTVRVIKCEYCNVTNAVSSDYRCVACGAPLPTTEIITTRAGQYPNEKENEEAHMRRMNRIRWEL